MATVEDITCHPLVVRVLTGTKRILAHKTFWKEPIITDSLLSLVDRFGTKDASLADVRALTFCLLGFAGFLRYDELSRLHAGDVTIRDDYMELFIESSKTDQWRGGNCTYWHETLPCDNVREIHEYGCHLYSSRWVLVQGYSTYQECMGAGLGRKVV